ncbi:hypothetical protein ILYODFUR_025225 [Ilyodon furcidens]|uniref:Uncharacterized protein n=1 Tax=Ilyodon furcidens TaxID=33524 RepID=A0ABV0U9M5_9TELE
MAKSMLKKQLTATQDLQSAAEKAKNLETCFVNQVIAFCLNKISEIQYLVDGNIRRLCFFKTVPMWLLEMSCSIFSNHMLYRLNVDGSRCIVMLLPFNLTTGSGALYVFLVNKPFLFALFINMAKNIHQIVQDIFTDIYRIDTTPLWVRCLDSKQLFRIIEHVAIHSSKLTNSNICKLSEEMYT